MQQEAVQLWLLKSWSTWAVIYLWRWLNPFAIVQFVLIFLFQDKGPRTFWAACVLLSISVVSTLFLSRVGWEEDSFVVQHMLMGLSLQAYCDHIESLISAVEWIWVATRHLQRNYGAGVTHHDDIMKHQHFGAVFVLRICSLYCLWLSIIEYFATTRDDLARQKMVVCLSVWSSLVQFRRALRYESAIWFFYIQYMFSTEGAPLVIYCIQLSSQKAPSQESEAYDPNYWRRLC